MNLGVLIRIFTRAGPLISLQRTATVTEIEFENQNHQDYIIVELLVLCTYLLAFKFDVFSHEVHCEYAAIGI